MMMKTFTKAQQAALDHTRHIALTANAGSGKTFVLTERLLQILSNDPDVNIKNIAAITFTEKAASELYKKIAHALDEQIEQAESADEKEKFIRFRKYLVSAQITTIHSFCANLLREFPVEAGLDAEFAIIDVYSASRLIEQSLASLIEEKKDDPVLLGVLRLLKGTGNFAQAMHTLLQRREIIEKLRETLYRGTMEDISQRLTEQFNALCEEVIIPVYKRCVEVLQIMNREVLLADGKNKYALALLPILQSLSRENLTALPTPKAIALLAEVQAQVLKKDFTPKQVYVKKVESGFADDDIACIASLYELIELLATPDESLLTQLASTGSDLLCLFDDLMDKYAKRKKENAFLDFDDLALFTRALLKNEYVKATLAERFKYIMIDEYQDTNELQYEIFMPILDELQKGNLFIVGDEKQSIYMFRNAELEVFSKTRREIIAKEDSTASITLRESFRMAPELGLFVNTIFETVFANPRSEYNESEHSEIIYIERQPKTGSVTFLVSHPVDAGASEDAESETEAPGVNETHSAEMIARQIVKMKQAHGYAWKDFAILSFKNDSFHVFRNIFPAYQIPYMIYGGKGFYETQSVLDISCYLQFLTDERNDLALAAVLKSPFYLFDDTTLMNIAAAPGLSFYSRLRNCAQGNEQLRAATDLLAKHLEQAKFSGAPQLLRSLLDDTMFLGVAAHRPDGDQILADIEKVMAMAIERESAGFENLYDFAAFLKSAIEEGMDETHAPLAVDSDAVQLMTIHKSKGLEFKVVVLCEANKPFIPERIAEGKVYVDKQLGIMTKLPDNGDYFADYLTPSPVGLYNYIRKKKQQAEQKRYLYVALTRAEEHLVISAELSRKGGIRANSLLAYMAEALGEGIVSADFEISGSLQCLNVTAIDQPPQPRPIRYTIPVLADIKEYPVIEQKDKGADHNYIIDLSRVKEEKGAYVISASGYVRFSQCPLQFHLYQHQRLHEFMESDANTEYDFDDNADQADGAEAVFSTEGKVAPGIQGLALKRGNILHKLIETGTSPENAEDVVLDLLLDTERDAVPAAIRPVVKQIVRDYTAFISSEAFQAIVGEERYSSEYELSTVLDGNVYLNGVIDRIIWEDGAIRLIDWKTDQIDRKQLAGRCAYYEKQLLFYAFIVSRLFPEAKRIAYTLAFVSHENFTHSGEFGKADFEKFEEDIRQIIRAINEKSYQKNTSYCLHCVFKGKDRTCVVG
jgi:ATP-dependent helicase/nuclease subunit A